MEKKANTEFTELTRLAEVYTESAGEYSLPDYERDVRKILYSSATVQPAGRFVGNDDVAFSGIIVYNLVYIDPEGQLSSLSFTSDYDYTVKCSSESFTDSYASARVASFAVRLIGPRRVSARASVVGSVSIVGKREIGVFGNGFSLGESPISREEEIKVRTGRFGRAEEREYAESLALIEGALLDEVEVVYSDAECAVESVSVHDGGCDIKASLSMTALIKNGDEPAYTVEKRIPVTAEVELTGLSESASVIPTLSVSSVKTNINPRETGCEVVMSTILDASVACEYNESVSVVADAYLTSYPTEVQYEDMGYSELLSVTREEWRESTVVPKSALESERPREMLFLTASPKAESVKCTAKGAEITGEIKYEGVMSETAEDGRITYTPVKYSAPFKKNVNINCQNLADLDIRTAVRAHSASAVIDGDNIILESSVELYLTSLFPKTERRLSSFVAKTDEPYRKMGPVVTVYYPTASDTLFSVAKRFHTTPVRIAEDNATEVRASAYGAPDSLAGVKRILIY